MRDIWASTDVWINPNTSMVRVIMSIARREWHDKWFLFVARALHVLFINIAERTLDGIHSLFR